MEHVLDIFSLFADSPVVGLKSENKVGKTSYGTVRENFGDGGGVHSTSDI